MKCISVCFYILFFASLSLADPAEKSDPNEKRIGLEEGTSAQSIASKEFSDVLYINGTPVRLARSGVGNNEESLNTILSNRGKETSESSQRGSENSDSSN